MVSSIFYRYSFKLIDIITNLSNYILQSFLSLLLKYVSSNTIHKIFVEYRSLLIMFIIVPASFFYDLFMRIRSWIFWLFLKSDILHDIKVQNIQNQVLNWRRNGKQKKMVVFNFIFIK